MVHAPQPHSFFDGHLTAHQGGEHWHHHVPLIGHLMHLSDWQSANHRSTHTANPHKITITDLENDKQILADSHRSNKERSRAVGELLKSGITDVRVADRNGDEHHYHLDQREKNGITETRVTENNKLVFDSFDDANGNGNMVPHMEGGAPSSRYVMRVPRHRPVGLSYPGTEPGAVGHYREPVGGTRFEPAGHYDHHVWKGVRNTDGSVTLNFRGCQVDTDGSGAYRHTEDRCRQSNTSLHLSNGRALDTDRDSFFVLPPSVAHAYGIHKGDLGWLVQKRTGKAVPVVFGDSGPEGKLGEASIAALKPFGYNVDGAHGVDNDNFQVVFFPGSGDGTGDIARQGTQAMAAKLDALGSKANAVATG